MTGVPPSLPLQGPSPSPTEGLGAWLEGQPQCSEEQRLASTHGRAWELLRQTSGHSCCRRQDTLCGGEFGEPCGGQNNGPWTSTP